MPVPCSGGRRRRSMMPRSRTPRRARRRSRMAGGMASTGRSCAGPSCEGAGVRRQRPPARGPCGGVVGRRARGRHREDSGDARRRSARRRARGRAARPSRGESAAGFEHRSPQQAHRPGRGEDAVGVTHAVGGAGVGEEAVPLGRDRRPAPWLASAASDIGGSAVAVARRPVRRVGPDSGARRPGRRGRSPVTRHQTGSPASPRGHRRAAGEQAGDRDGVEAPVGIAAARSRPVGMRSQPWSRKWVR